MNDVLVGMRRTDTRTIVEPDRAAAIHKAIEEAHAGDIVILAGKGHENVSDLSRPHDSFRRPGSGARSAAGVRVPQEEGAGQ
jgi:UDP-N-acetylmuramyl tripeptide synthase